MWRNKAVSDTYESGSTFKIFTIAMALEENVVSENDTFHCILLKKVANRTIRCWKSGGHGTQTLLKQFKTPATLLLLKLVQGLAIQSLSIFLMVLGLWKRPRDRTKR